MIVLTKLRRAEAEVQIGTAKNPDLYVPHTYFFLACLSQYTFRCDDGVRKLNFSEIVVTLIKQFSGDLFSATRCTILLDQGYQGYEGEHIFSISTQACCGI